jgi:hypothetical protein
LAVTGITDHPQVDTQCNGGSGPVTGPADTSIVAGFTVKSTPATAAEAAGQALPTTGDGGTLPVLILWGTALLLTGAGALTVLPARSCGRAALSAGRGRTVLLARSCGRAALSAGRGR